MSGFSCLDWQRRLVQCRLAVPGLRCGNRLEVISVGYSISQRGQAQESCAMLASILMVAVLGSVFGRKAGGTVGIP